MAASLEKNVGRRGSEAIQRRALFISHANPQDNEFTLWLGAKLNAMGYEVWADVLRLLGGDDWPRRLEGALRHRSIKMLLVCTPAGLDKQGVRNEIEIASQVGKSLGDENFIIPLRRSPFEPPFQIATRQYVDFSSWSEGLLELVALLRDEYKVPARERSRAGWHTLRSLHGKRVVAQSEPLTSNWLAFRHLPRDVQYCEPPVGFPLDQFHDRQLHLWPAVPFSNGIITFARPDAAGNLSPNLPGSVKSTTRLRDFVNRGWEALGIQSDQARHIFSNLANQGFEAFFKQRGLRSYENAKGVRWWWADIRAGSLKKVRFSWRQQRGSRQILGQSGKRGVHWHYAISTQVRTGPVRHVRLSPRLIFSENGLDPMPDPLRMNRLRRSFAKGWRNARWRDMQGAFLWWIGRGAGDLRFAVSHQDEIVVVLPALQFRVPVSVPGGSPEPDDDDPDLEFSDELDDDFEPGAEGPEAL